MISLWHIAATVVFLLVGLQSVEHFGPSVLIGLLAVACQFKANWLQLMASFLCKHAFLVITALSINPTTKLFIWRIFMWHIAATVVFLLVGLKSLEHFGPSLVLQGLFVVRTLISGHCCCWKNKGTGSVKRGVYCLPSFVDTCHLPDTATTYIKNDWAIVKKRLSDC